MAIPTPAAQPAQQSQSAANIDILESVLKNIGYNFKLNIVTDRIEVIGKRCKLLDDKLFKVIYAEVSRKFKTTIERLDIAVNEMAYRNQYHPVKDYLASLSYDGDNHFQNLIYCFDNPDGLLPIWLRKWMLGVIAKTMTGAQNPMLVLNGPQRIGKSLFAKWLCSGIPAYFVETSIDTDDKDTFDLLASRWIWEVSELGASLRRSDLEALKHFITMAEVTIRPAYGKFSMTRPALANLVGTINDRGGGFFDDPTGSRRFLICDVNKIDWTEYTKINVNQLWAEINVAYIAGEGWELSLTERALQEEKNKDYQPRDSIEDHLVDGFEIDLAKVNDPDYFTPVIFIVEYLQNIKNFKAGSTMALNKLIAQTAKHLGLEAAQLRVPPRVLGQPYKIMRGYKGIKKL